jgi:hypothetical protein
LYGHLVENFWPIVDYLSAARIVHVTSLFDDDSPDVVADILEYVVAHNPLVRVSFDPGHDWTKWRRDAVMRILNSCSLLFVNEQELFQIFETYCEFIPDPDEANVAQAVLCRMRPDAALVVVKHRGATSLYGASDKPIQDEIATVTAVEDDTGAGDYFAASVLAAQLSPVLSCRFGAVAGMYLAREKLAYVGPPSDSKLPELLQHLSIGLGSGTQADVRERDTRGAEQLLPLCLLLVGRDEEALERLESVLGSYSSVKTVRVDNVGRAAEEFKGPNRIDGAFVDIFSLGAAEGTGLIALGREERPEVGFVLYGNRSEVHELPGVSETWRTLLEKYWSLRKDLHPHAFSAKVEDSLLLLLLYRFSDGQFGKAPGEIVKIVTEGNATHLLRSLLRPRASGELSV